MLLPLLPAELPEKLQLVTLGPQKVLLKTPPPKVVAELPVKIQLVNTGEEA